MPMLDRQLGTVLGLAIGDALGAAVEFRSPGTFPKVTGYRGGGPHGLAPGDFHGADFVKLPERAWLPSRPFRHDEPGGDYGPGTTTGPDVAGPGTDE